MSYGQHATPLSQDFYRLPMQHSANMLRSVHMYQTEHHQHGVLSVCQLGMHVNELSMHLDVDMYSETWLKAAS